jgi:hypothetical protein
MAPESVNVTQLERDYLDLNEKVSDVMTLLLRRRRGELTAEEAILWIEKVVWPDNPEKGIYR